METSLMGGRRQTFRAKLRAADQTQLRAGFEDFLENEKLSPARVAQQANVSASTLTRWLKGETRAKQATLLRMVDTFPELVDRFGLADVKANLREIQLIGVCRGVEIRPFRPTEAKRSIRVPRTVDDAFLDGWTGVLVLAEGYPQWQNVVAAIDSTVVVESLEDYLPNQSYLVIEKGSDDMYIGWISVEGGSVALSDGLGKLLKKGVVPEYGHPVVAYLFNPD